MRAPWPLAAGLLLALACGAGDAREADLVLRHAAIHTMDAAQPRATALAIANGRLAYVGGEAGVAAYIGAATRVVDLAGRAVLPGLQDSHGHPMSSGLWLARCRLGGAASVAALKATIRACDAALPAGEWLLGRGWEPAQFGDAELTRQALDELVPDRPAYLASVEGRSAWVNSAALAVAGIDAATPDPPGGRIGHDADGTPSGLLFDTATYLVMRHAPRPTQAEYREALRRVSALANAQGITAMIDASVDPPMLDAYRAADRAGELTLRMVATQRVDHAQGPEQVAAMAALARQARGSRLRADAAKIFLDGEIERRTSALLEPYAGFPAERGKLLLQPDALDALVRALDGAGFQVHMHTMGDRAVRVALDAFERAAAANGPRERRHVLSHLELVDPADLPRFARLGVAADIQPAWAWRDARIATTVEPLLGAARSRRLYPNGSLAASGAPLVAGSDWPATPLNAWQAMGVAMTRQAPEGGASWLPDQRIGLQELLRAYTIAGARLAGMQEATGSLEAGKLADLVVLDRDPHDLPARELGSIEVLLTLLEGEVVYRAPGFAWP